MNIFLKKLHSTKGETLVETLVSITLVGLAMVMLATAISTSSKLTQQAKNEDSEFDDELMDAEAYQNPLDDLTQGITIKNDETGELAVINSIGGALNVKYYGTSEDTLLRTYKVSFTD